MWPLTTSQSSSFSIDSKQDSSHSFLLLPPACILRRSAKWGKDRWQAKSSELVRYLLLLVHKDTIDKFAGLGRCYTPKRLGILVLFLSSLSIVHVFGPCRALQSAKVSTSRKNFPALTYIFMPKKGYTLSSLLSSMTYHPNLKTTVRVYT